MKMKNENTSKVIASLPGSMSIHDNGEMDMRGVYCTLVIADILNLLGDKNKEGSFGYQLVSGMSDFIASC